MPACSLVHTVPILDVDNPMYCPDIPAERYINSVRLFSASLEERTGSYDTHASIERFPYFHKMKLAFDSDTSLYAYDQLSIDFRTKEVTTSTTTAKTKTLISAVNDSSALDMESLLGSPTARDITQRKTSSYAQPEAATEYHVDKHVDNPDFMKKRKNSDAVSSDSSDFHGLLGRPAKRVKHSSSEVAESFVISKVDRLQVIREHMESFETDSDAHIRTEQTAYWPDSELNSSINRETTKYKTDAKKKCTCGAGKSLQDELYGPEVGFQTPRSIVRLINGVHKLLPGIHIKTQLQGLSTHQDIANILGIKGHLSYSVLSLLRNAKILELNLTETITDADGLNLGRNDILKVFKSPNSFLHLQKLVFSDVPLIDEDILNFNELPGLESLFLDNTQIGDEAVMHLVALKHTLSFLDLAWNEAVTDDSIPSLCALVELEILSLKGTGITINGLRKLAWHIKQHDQERRIGLIVPNECEEYLYDVHNHYALQLTSQSATEPQQVSRLALAEVKRNLEQHAKGNSKISTEGTVDDLKRRLRELLDRRQKDFALRGFLVQGLV